MTLASIACYFEQGNFDECIKTCEKAVEEGREQRADFKLVAKCVNGAFHIPSYTLVAHTC